MKGIGMVFILAGAFYIGQKRAGNCRRQVLLLEEWLQKIEQLKGEIQYGKTPLPQAFERLGQSARPTPVTQFFQKMGERLQQYGQKQQFYTIWEEEGKGLFQQMALSKEEFLLLGQSMGQLHTAVQTKQVERYVQYLTQRLQEQRSQLPVRQKVERTVSLAVGSLLVMILL